MVFVSIVSVFINSLMISFSLMVLNAACFSLVSPKNRTLIKGLHPGSLDRNDIPESKNEEKGKRSTEERKTS